MGSIFGGLVVANLMMFALGLLACRAFLPVLKLKRSTLIPIILLLCFVGTYALERSIFDIWVMWFFGAIGYIMRKFNFPLPPVILGRVLGTILESNFWRSTMLSEDDPTIFIYEPISLLVLILAFIILFWPVIHGSLTVFRAKKMEKS